MESPEEKLVEFYRRQSLAPEKSAAILAEGRRLAARHRRQKMMWRTLGIAAGVSVVCGLAWVGLRGPATTPPVAIAAAEGVSLANVQEELVAFFSRPDYELDQVSLDQDQLVGWLRQQGAPALVVPAVMEGLDNLGCEIISIGDQQVYVLCFYLDGAPVDAAGVPMPGKKPMMASAEPAAEPGGESSDSPAPMMKKPAALMHLVSVPRDRFVGAPQIGAPVQVSRQGEWSFATWAQGDVVYIAGSPVDHERFSALAGRLTES